MGKCYLIPSFLSLFRLSEDISMAFLRFRRVNELPSGIKHADENGISEILQDDILYLASDGIPENESVAPEDATQASEEMLVPPEAVASSETATPFPEGTKIYYYEITFLFDDCNANSSKECAHFAWFHGAPGAPVDTNQN